MTTVVGIPDQLAELAAVVLPEPIQLVEHHVRQHGEITRTLGDALVAGEQLPVFQHARLQPLPQQLQHPPVADPLLHQLHEQRRGRFGRRTPRCRLHHPVRTAVHALADSAPPPGGHSASAGTRTSCPESRLRRSAPAPPSRRPGPPDPGPPESPTALASVCLGISTRRTGSRPVPSLPQLGRQLRQVCTSGQSVQSSRGKVTRHFGAK